MVALGILLGIWRATPQRPQAHYESTQAADCE